MLERQGVKLALKLLPYGLLALLLIAFLWQRNTLTKTTADLDAANVRVEDVTAANATLAEAIKKAKQAQIDNDAIAVAVAGKLEGNRVREIRTREVIRETIENDPQSNDWANQPLPSRLREALRPGSVSTPAS